MEVPKKKKTFNPISNDSIKKLTHSKSVNTDINIKKNVSLPKNAKLSKRFLVAHKVNFNDKKSNFFIKGIKDLFNNENFYFSTKYYNHEIRIGNDNKKYNTIEPRLNNIDRKLFTKKKTRNFLIRKASLSSNQIKTLLGNNNQKRKIDDSSNMSVLSKYDYKNPSNNNTKDNYVKRPSIFFNNRQLVTDNDLKMYFDHLKKSMKKSRNIKNYFSSSSMNFNTSLKKEINNRICLQEKILKDFKRNEKSENNLVNRLIKLTKKNDKDLLINQVDNYRNKIEKIDKNSKKYISNDNYKMVIQWLSSLRKYGKDNKNNNNEKKEIDNFNNTNKTLKINKEEILNNYINKLSYSFGNDTKLYSDIESNIYPLCGLIVPSDDKNKERIKNFYFNEKGNSPIIIGKNLLNYEIGLTKYLEGKRKLIIRKTYHDDDIKPLIFSETRRIDKFSIPGSVNNAFEVHNNK